MYNKMMSGCRCPHHLVGKVLVILVWVAAVLFFWTTFKGVAFLALGVEYYFRAVVVLAILAVVGGKACGCCEGKMMCQHGEGETCEHCK